MPHHPGRRFIYCLLTALLCWNGFSAATAQAQMVLRYRYTPADQLHYELKQTLTTSAVIAGKAMENTLSQQLQLSTRVDAVRPDGSAVVTKKIDRIQMQATQPGQDKSLEYDSQTGEEVTGPLAMIVKSMSQLVGEEIKMTMSPQGEASDVQLPASMDRFFGQQSAGVAGLNTPEGIKKMISQGSVIFPVQPVTPDHAWNRELTTELPFGTMRSVIELTYAGMTKEGLHRINAVSNIELTPKPGAPFEVTMKASEGRGIYLFDAERGCIYASALKQTMDLEMSALGQTMQQKVVTDITMRLVEPTTRTASRP